MSELTDEDFVFVEVTKTFMMSKAEASRMVRVARLVCAARETISEDEDGTETTTFGEDFLTDEGEHDYADALGQLRDPEGLLGIEMIQTACRYLDAQEVEEHVRFWPEDWRSEALSRKGDTPITGLGD